MTTLRFHPYSITSGGLLDRLDRWLRLSPGAKQAWRLRALLYILVAYVPQLVLGVVLRLTTGHWDPVIALVDTHVRALVAAPMLLYAEHAVDLRARMAGEYLVAAEIIREQDVTSYGRTIERTERLRNSVIADILLLLIAIASQWFDLTALWHAEKPAHYWGSFLALGLFRFLLLRWLWRWLLWATFLRRVARMPLSLSATHPDAAGGLAQLAGPSESFAFVGMAGAVSVAGAWFDRMQDGVPFSAFYSSAATYVLLVLAIAVAPLLVFTRALYLVRKAGLFAYGAFARRYCDAFEAKWFERSGEAALGAEDISALADLGASYSVLPKMRIFVFDTRVLLAIAAASFLPMLPLALADVGFVELLFRVLKALV